MYIDQLGSRFSLSLSAGDLSTIKSILERRRAAAARDHVGIEKIVLPCGRTVKTSFAMKKSGVPEIRSAVLVP